LIIARIRLAAAGAGSQPVWRLLVRNRNKLAASEQARGLRDCGPGDGKAGCELTGQP